MSLEQKAEIAELVSLIPGANVPASSTAAGLRLAAAGEAVMDGDWKGAAGNSLLFILNVAGVVPGVALATKPVNMGIQAILKSRGLVEKGVVVAAQARHVPIWSVSVWADKAMDFGQTVSKGGILGFGVRTGEEGGKKVFALYTFKHKKGTNIPQGWGYESQYRGRLDDMERELRKLHPDAIIHKNTDFSALPTHPSGLGAREKGWVD